MTDRQHDKEFEAFVSGDSELADRYAELGHEEPPPEVDARILAEARKVANVRQVQFGPRGGWLKPIALAATVVLSFSLVMNIVVESPVRDEQVVVDSPDERDAELAATNPQRPASRRTMSDQMSEEIDGGENLAGKIIEEKTVQLRKDSISDAEIAAGSPGSSPVQQDRSARSRPVVADEITVTAGFRSSDQPESGEYAESDTPLAAPPVAFDERSVDHDAALLIVAQYIAAADAPAGRTAGSIAYKKDAGKAEGAGPGLASSPALARRKAPVEEREQDDDYKIGPDDHPDNKPDGQTESGPESMLRDIQRLNAGGEPVAAAARLDEFLARYPDHPVSIMIRQRGDDS